ncbi:MAG: hypothetical protein QM758_05355 [Armatimonas sp.]
MFRLLVVLSVLSVLSACVHANDMSISGVGGSATPIKGEDSSVVMSTETVSLELYKDHYETIVCFIFKNEGKAKTVTMGFPERGFGIDGGDAKASISHFRSYVDGIPVETKRVVSQHNQDDYVAYWTKTVPFQRNQSHKVIVHFSSPYGGGIGGTSVGYDFTGGNWKGKVQASS